MTYVFFKELYLNQFKQNYLKKSIFDWHVYVKLYVIINM